MIVQSLPGKPVWKMMTFLLSSLPESTWRSFCLHISEKLPGMREWLLQVLYRVSRT